MDESIQKHLEQPQQVGTIKLSVAIRIGSLIRPQCTGEWYVGERSCALGAAAEAIGKRGYAEQYMRENEARPYNEVPRWFGVPAGTEMEVALRNDRGETREEIADWLEARGL